MTLGKQISGVLEPAGQGEGDGSQAVRGIQTVVTPSDSGASRSALMAGRRWVRGGLRLASGSPDRSKCSWRGEQAGRAEAGIDRTWGPMGREEGQERSGEDSFRYLA